MPNQRPILVFLACAALAAALPPGARADEIRTVTVAAASLAAGTVLEGRITGYDQVRYVVHARAGEIISVDLESPNGGLSFNILAPGAEEALFNGSISGNVADVVAPAEGDYAVELSLMRSAARRGEAAPYTLGIGIGTPDFADGLAGGPDWWQVTGLEPGSALNIRSGPGTRYPVTGKAQSGETMQNRGCRMSGAERWCSVRVQGSGTQGWVAGRFLAEAAAPRTPDMPEGGPKGEGAAFDATGAIRCATALGQPMQDCLFGVVRDGPGNAGVWIALGGGQERQILFEGGQPVSANVDAELGFSKAGDLFTVSVGDERFEIPEAVVNGG